MIKFIVCITRKPGMSRAQFQDYWRNHHAPLVVGVQEFSRHLRKYVQCHLLSDVALQQKGNDYDGVAELWFDSLNELEAAFREPKYLELIRPDEAKFADLHKTLRFIVQEYPII